MLNPIPKSKQLAYRNKRRDRPAWAGSESSLQKFTNDYLEWHGLDFIRIPDQFFRWLNAVAPEWAKIAFNRAFRGIADNVVFYPIGDYSLCLHLELKSAKGTLHGKQKPNARRQNWHIGRSPEEVKEIINQFVTVAESMRQEHEKRR